MPQKLEKLAASLAKCAKCGLGKTRTNLVFGEGSEETDILFIGEGPGQKEDELGRPFVGAAGKLLDELIASVALERKDVYIANVVKCRPPGNRDPLPEEVAACWPHLEEQVHTIRPKLIVLLGRHSLERFLPGQKISEVHGKPLRRDFPGLGRQVFFPVYHPAAALYQGSLRQTLFSDFKKIPRILKMVGESVESVVEVDGGTAVKSKPGIPKKQEKLF